MSLTMALQNDQPTHDEAALALAMVTLGRLLDDEGYHDLYRLTTGGRLYAPDLSEGLANCTDMCRPQRALARLFALGLPVHADELKEDDSAGNKAAAIAALRQCGLVDDTSSGVMTAGFVIASVMGGYLLVGTPPMYRPSAAIGASGYLGNDSISLAGALPRCAGRRVLDLGAGSGIQGLLAARGATEAVLTDIDGDGLRLARANAYLNEIAHPVSYRVGDGYEPVANERFDLIVTLAPYLPSIPRGGTSSVVEGGRDGLSLIRRFARGAACHLSPGGEFVALAQLLCDDNGPLLSKELAELTPGLDARVSLSDWQPLQPYLFELASKLAAHGSPLGRKGLMERYGASLRDLNVTGVCSSIIRLHRPLSDERPTRQQLFGRAPVIRPTDVVALGDTVIDWQAAQVSLCAGDGTTVTVNGPTAALLRGCDGTRSIAEVVRAAWGSMDSRMQRDLEDQAIARLSELANLGLVELG